MTKAHFIDENFYPITRFLESLLLDNFHKGADVSKTLNYMIAKYGIKKLHLIVRRVGMKNAAKLKEYESIWCLTDMLNWVCLFY